MYANVCIVAQSDKHAARVEERPLWQSLLIASRPPPLGNPLLLLRMNGTLGHYNTANIHSGFLHFWNLAAWAMDGWMTTCNTVHADPSAAGPLLLIGQSDRSRGPLSHYICQTEDRLTLWIWALGIVDRRRAVIRRGGREGFGKVT